MMKYLLLGFNNGNIAFNQAIQSFAFSDHPNIERIFEQDTNGTWPVATPESVGISIFPGLAFMALTGRKPNGDACYKVAKVLQGGGITREHILSAIPSIPPIVDFSCGGGNVPGAGGEGDLQLNGLLSLPPWLLGLGTLYAGYKTINAGSGVGRMAYGALTAVWGTKYLQEQAARQAAPLPIGRLQLPIGKTNDTTPIKSGSRLERAWAGKLTERDFTGRSKAYTVKDVTAAAIVDKFGLHSVEFGKWVPEDERRQFLVGLDDCLRDLAKVLRIPHRKMGLKKTLACTYGARGKGGRALATYSPHYVLINLTRENGLGSFAHEYGHALDYHMARGIVAPSGGVTVSTSLLQTNRKTARGYMEKALESLILTSAGDVNAWREKLDKLPDYWRQRNEIWARSFETLIHTEMKGKGFRNKMLTHGNYGAFVYPTPAILKKARKHIIYYSRFALNH